MEGRRIVDIITIAFDAPPQEPEHAAAGIQDVTGAQAEMRKILVNAMGSALEDYFAPFWVDEVLNRIWTAPHRPGAPGGDGAMTLFRNWLLSAIHKKTSETVVTYPVGNKGQQRTIYGASFPRSPWARRHTKHSYFAPRQKQPEVP